jgi:hypothetical protein
MRPAPGRATLAAMKTASPKQRVILDAAIDRSAAHGTLIAPSGEVHGWRELNTALDFCLGARSARVQLGLWTEKPLRRFRVCELEDGCERQSQSFVEGCHTMPVRRA